MGNGMLLGRHALWIEVCHSQFEQEDKLAGAIH